MNRILGIGLFLIVFISVYFGAHLYVLLRFSGFFGIKRGIWLYGIAALFALSFIGASILERYFNGPLTKLIYSISASWVGAVFLCITVLAIYEIVKLFVKIQPRTAGIVILAIVLLLAAYGIINAMSIVVKEAVVPVPNLEKEVTIVQLSDIHLGTVHKASYMQNIVDKVNALNPDMVLITGDLLDVAGRLPETSITPLNGLNAKSFFSIGNHEKYAGIDDVMKLMAKTNVKVLRNEAVEYKGIQIIGIDHPDHDFQKTIPALSAINISKKMPSILMYHTPLGLDDAAAAGITLQVSGHTHSGQITPFDLIDAFFYPHVYGLHKYKGMYLYITSGTGTWGPPMRVGSRSEIALIRLVRG